MRLYHIILLLLFAITMSCSKQTEACKEAGELRKEIRADLISCRPDLALNKSIMLREITSEDCCRSEYISALVYIGQAYMMLQEVDSMSLYYEKAMALALKYNDNWAIGTIYNALGVYYRKDELTSVKAIKYFLKGLTYAEKIKDDTLLSNLKCNLALSYYMRNDPEGKRYALDVYKSGILHDDGYMQYMGSFISSYLYYGEGDYDSALYYIDIAMPLSEKIESDYYSLWTLYGDILMAKGDEDEALEYYKKAFYHDESAARLSGIDIYLSYGKYLKKKGMYDSALVVVERGIRLSDSTFNDANAYKLYTEAADICSLMHDYQRAEYYRGIYERYKDSIFNYKNERIIYNDKLSLYREEYEESIDVANRNLKIIVGLSLFLLIVICAVLWIIHLRSRKRMLESLKKNRKQELLPVSDEKMNVMFERLETLMKDKRIYADRNITREKIAEILDTNRTYITKIVHAHTGMNLAAYINKYRIEEAARILSDRNDMRSNKEIASDLGFSSVSNFYKLFGAMMGMSPAQYKKEKESAG